MTSRSFPTQTTNKRPTSRTERLKVVHNYGANLLRTLYQFIRISSKTALQKEYFETMKMISNLQDFIFYLRYFDLCHIIFKLILTRSN